MAFTDMPTLALSPDGRKIAFTVSGTARTDVDPRAAFDQAEARPIAGTEGGTGPFFSPDGASLGFFADRRVKAISLAGGTAQTVADAPNGRGGPVGDPTARSSSCRRTTPALWRVPAAGGKPQPVVSPETDKGERTYRWPVLLPGGRAVLFTVGSRRQPERLRQGPPRGLLLRDRRAPRGGGGRQHGRLRASRHSRLLSAPECCSPLVSTPPGWRSSGRRRPCSRAWRATRAVARRTSRVATDGTLAVVRGAGSKVNRLLTLVDRKGLATPLPLSARGFRHPRFSPDGTRLAFTVGSAMGLGTDADVWVYSLSSGSLNRLTFDGAPTPRGRRPATGSPTCAPATRRSSRSPPTAPGPRSRSRLQAPTRCCRVPGAPTGARWP